MAEQTRDNEPAAPESPVQPREVKTGGKKKKKKRGCGFFLLLIVLAAGAAYGLQASGAVDLRDVAYPLIPKIPYVGETLKEWLDIPDVYAMTAEERRRIELEEWESRIAETVRSMDEREQHLNLRSDDLGELERALEAEREDLATRVQALNDEIARREAEPSAQRGTEADRNAIDETIRTFQDMSPRNAAAILEALDENLAVTILDGLSLDSRGSLLGRMDADKAARLTEQLSDLQRRRSRQGTAE